MAADSSEQSAVVLLQVAFSQNVLLVESPEQVGAMHTILPPLTSPLRHGGRLEILDRLLGAFSPEPFARHVDRAPWSRLVRAFRARCRTLAQPYEPAGPRAPVVATPTLPADHPTICFPEWRATY